MPLSVHRATHIEARTTHNNATGGSVEDHPKENAGGLSAKELTEAQKRAIEERLRTNPILGFMGIEVLEVAPGRATVLLHNREELHNSLGLVQGGVLAVVADVAGGVSLYSVLTDPLEVTIPTVEFKLSFLRPVAAEDVVARGWVVHRGRRLALCQVDVSGQSGRHLATGLFTYMVKPREELDMTEIS
jgi:uncharacterized protein (TIGR00369 family)